MARLKSFKLVFLSTLLLLTSACAGGTAAAPVPAAAGEATPQVSAGLPTPIRANGVLRPVRQREMSFGAGGFIETVEVEAGEAVRAGQVLARLDTIEVGLAVTQAKVKLAAAQQEELDTKQAVGLAEQEVVNARQVITDLTTATATALNLAQVQTDVANLQKQIDDAQRNLRYLTTPDLKYYQEEVARARDALTMTQQTAELTDLQIAVTQAKESLDQRTIELNNIKALEGWGGAKPVLEAQKNYDVAVDILTNAELRLAQSQIANGNAADDAQKAVDHAQRALASAMQGPNAIKLAQAQASLALLQAQLTDAQAVEAKLKANGGLDADQLKAAQDRLANAQGQVQSAQARAVTAQAQVEVAHASLEAAQSQVENMVITAPFAGIISTMRARPGQWAAPGELMVTVLDTSRWRIETKNVSELQIGQIRIGQAAQVRVNAFKSEALSGQVVAIEPVAIVQQGDTTYTLTIEVEPTELNLLPGMTAQVEITIE
jgi:HlyD family secretion protein